MPNAIKVGKLDRGCWRNPSSCTDSITQAKEQVLTLESSEHQLGLQRYPTDMRTPSKLPVSLYRDLRLQKQ
jgi:hypothetical protein